MKYPLDYIYITNAFKGTHYGIDFGYKSGDENIKVYAIDDGVVIYRYKQASGGNVLHIRHANGYVSEYAHLESFNVKLNDKIKRGQVIGIMGATGKVTGKHLHLGLYKGNKIDYNDRTKFVNPLKYLCLFDDQTLNSTTKKNYTIFKSKKAFGIPKSEIGEAMYIRKNNSEIVGKIANGEEIAYFGKYSKNTKLAVVDNIRLYTTLDVYLK